MIHPGEHDLILATHGRGILIVDDITPLRQLSSKILEKDINDANAAFEAIIGKELAGVNSRLAGKKLDPINVMTKEEYDKKQQDK